MYTFNLMHLAVSSVTNVTTNTILEPVLYVNLQGQPGPNDITSPPALKYKELVTKQSGVSHTSYRI